MQEGWFNRHLTNEQLNRPKSSNDVNIKYEESASDDENQDDTKDQNVSSSSKAVNYKSQYRFLKRKLKFLIYENEFFQDALRSNQRRLLKVSRDRAFLLDRLLQYEKPENTSSESEETESSEEDIAKEQKRRKLQESLSNATSTSAAENGSMRGRKRKIITKPSDEPLTINQTGNLQVDNINHATLSLGAELEIEQEPQCHLSAAEVERHLQSKQPIMDLLSERAPATVPTEMFSMEQPLENLN